MHKFLVAPLLITTSKFTVRKGNGRWEAKIYSEDGDEVAQIKKGEGPEFRLLNKKNNHEWVLTNRVDGQHRRFSFTVRQYHEGEGTALLTVRDNIFEHKGSIYMLANHPAGKLWQHHVNSTVRYISRLDNFPGSEMEEENKHHHQNLRQNLKSFRGVPVGEASGLGAAPEGHTVKVSDELDDISLFLAAISYLMYASA